MILTLRPGKPLMPVPPKGPCEAPQKDTLSMEDADQGQASPVSQGTREKDCAWFSLYALVEAARFEQRETHLPTGDTSGRFERKIDK